MVPRLPRWNISCFHAQVVQRQPRFPVMQPRVCVCDHVCVRYEVRSAVKGTRERRFGKGYVGPVVFIVIFI